LSIREFITAHEENDIELLGRVADDPHVPDDWRHHAARTVARLAGQPRT
jgi:hypothetical protein